MNRANDLCVKVEDRGCWTIVETCGCGDEPGRVGESSAVVGAGGGIV